ncbi:MAG: hypothetical protein ACJ8GN_18925 [Longimicrobiaceae bacterium]
MIKGPNGKRVGRRRNLPAKPFIDFAARLAHDADRNGAKKLDLVLAGDIFDIHRSGLWFQPGGPGGPMPYDATVGPALETKAREILDAIERQDKDDGDGVHHALAVFRRLGANGAYLEDGREVEFPVPVRIHYLTGNHDRLCNATPGLRERVREILGIPPAAGERFPNQILESDPPVLIRHGHEYEFTNFSVDHSKLKRIPVDLPQAEYDAPAFGDLVTVQIASRLPVLFREHHGVDAILASPRLQAIYDRLIEFDDVRPQSALFKFVLNDPDVGSRAFAWNAVEPVLRKILAELSDNAFLRQSLKARDRMGVDVIDAVQTFLSLKLWKLSRKLPSAAIESIANRAHGAPGKPPVDYAAREAAVMDGRARLLIAGHTHNPTVELAASDKTHGERYYVDTGTWRNRVPSTPDGLGFGHLKALTYVVVYASNEDPQSGVGDPRGPAADPGSPAAMARLFSFDYWSGVTQRFNR